VKASIANVIATTPLRLPYFDLEAYKSIEPLEARYRASVSEIDSKSAEKYGIDPEHVPEIVLAQFQAGLYVSQKLKEKGIGHVEAAQLSGIDKTTLSKACTGKRPFSPTAAMLTPFCYNVMQESCHKVMFGRPGTILLPSTYSETARFMHSLSETEKKSLLNKAKVQYALLEKQNPGTVRNEPKRNQVVITGERLHELFFDKGVQAYQFFGPDTPYIVRNSIRQFVVDEYLTTTPRIGFLMFMALETGLALDYFIAEDFTKYTDCYYKEGNETFLIKDGYILGFIGICASLPPEPRQKLIGEAIGTSLCKTFK